MIQNGCVIVKQLKSRPQKLPVANISPSWTSLWKSHGVVVRCNIMVRSARSFGTGRRKANVGHGPRSGAGSEVRSVCPPWLSPHIHRVTHSHTRRGGCTHRNQMRALHRSCLPTPAATQNVTASGRWDSSAARSDPERQPGQTRTGAA